HPAARTLRRRRVRGLRNTRRRGGPGAGHRFDFRWEYFILAGSQPLIARDTGGQPDRILISSGNVRLPVLPARVIPTNRIGESAIFYTGAACLPVTNRRFRFE